MMRRANLKEVDGALILDCNAVLLKTTEAMVDLSKSIGLGASQRLLYQRPNVPRSTTGNAFITSATNRNSAPERRCGCTPT
jgi:hypothetical protein